MFVQIPLICSMLKDGRSARLLTHVFSILIALTIGVGE